MKLEGMIHTIGPAEEVLGRLIDHETLTSIAPSGFDFRKVENGSADFVIRRGFGPVILTLQGTMTLSDDAKLLEIKASHLIGGRVLVALNLTSDLPSEDGLGTIAWVGELTAQGLAGRLLQDNAERGNTILRNLFQRLRRHVEGE